MTDYQGITPPARLYAERDIEDQGEYYVRHVNAMTAEGLHSKSDIAAELAHRDIEIERLTKALRIAELKASGSLANNLCPDHRDKQTGKPCLACEIERLRTLVERAHTIISIREVSFRTHKGAAWIKQASRELNGEKSAPETIGFTELPPRPSKPARALNISTATEQEALQHYMAMTDYWIAEAQWQEKRGDQLNAELTAFLLTKARIACETTGEAEDAAKWRALRNCARITAMGSAGLGADKAAEDYGHVTLNFWTGVDDVDRGPEYARDWLDRFVEKALRAKVSRPAAAGVATGSTDQPAPEASISADVTASPGSAPKISVNRTDTVDLLQRVPRAMALPPDEEGWRLMVGSICHRAAREITQHRAETEALRNHIFNGLDFMEAWLRQFGSTDQLSSETRQWCAVQIPRAAERSATGANDV